MRTDKLRTILGQTLAPDAKRSGPKQGRKVPVPWGRKDAVENQELATPDAGADSDVPPSDD